MVYRVYSLKKQSKALWLCVFLGMLGIHRYYTGRIKSGILYTLTFGLFGFGWLADIILISTSLFRDKDNRKLYGDANRFVCMLLAILSSIAIIGNTNSLIKLFRFEDIKDIYITTESVVARVSGKQEAQEVIIEPNTILWVNSRIGYIAGAKYKNQWVHLDYESIKPLDRNLDIKEYLSDSSFFKYKVSTVDINNKTYNIIYNKEFGYDKYTGDYIDTVAELVDRDGNINFYICENFIEFSLESENYKCIPAEDVTFRYIEVANINKDVDKVAD